MKLFIEASNIRNGGGVTHLIEVLNNMPKNTGIDVTVVSNKYVLNRINNSSGHIQKISHPLLNKSFLYIALWRILYMKKAIQKCAPNIVFSPAGNFTLSSFNYISMCRNMLLYDQKEMNRYGYSWMKCKLLILRKVQLKSFKKASGVIFLSKHAKKSVNQFLKLERVNNKIIHHGISDKFIDDFRQQRDFKDINASTPFKLLYVSNWTVYKHHLNLIKAVHTLNKKGIGIQLTIVGGITHKETYNKAIQYIDNEKIKNNEVCILGKVDYNQIHEMYKKAEGFVYGSTCENMPNILIEAMSSGLPILCSSFEPMPEFLKDGGLYFDPENIDDTIRQMVKFVESKEIRNQMAQRSKELSFQYNWKQCAVETFDFIKEVNASYEK